jgi:hypothetical protein
MKKTFCALAGAVLALALIHAGAWADETKPIESPLDSPIHMTHMRPPAESGNAPQPAEVDTVKLVADYDDSDAGLAGEGRRK